MSKIAFFISDHGFGHIMRNIQVIAELIKRNNDVVIVSGEKQISLAREYIGDTADYVEINTDAGLVVKPGTLLLDEEKTKEKIIEHISKWDEYIQLAKTINADKFVVDIAPWALIAAKELGKPSYLMASFTWCEQYEGFLDAEYLNKYIYAFKCADRVLYYDLVNKPTRDLLGAGIEVGFVSRTFDDDVVKSIKENHKKPIAFLSLGGSNSGLDFDIDVTNLPYDFITTGKLKIIGDNVTYLDEKTGNTHEYVKASDFCISKAGWTTVSEMMIAGTKFRVLKRPDVPEDTMIIDELEKRNSAIGIDVSELLDMKSVMEKLEQFSKADIEYINGYMKIADIICNE